MKIIRLLTCSLALSLLGIQLIGCARSGIEIQVKNESRGEVTNVQLIAAHRTEILGTIPLHGQKSCRIRPTQESGLEVRFTNAAGQDVVRHADVYIDRGLSGTITIEINTNDDLKVASHVGA